MVEQFPGGGKRFLSGQIAIVTGAGRGIGRVVALTLASAGAGIVVASRSMSELEETASLVREHGCDCLAVTTDVTDESDCEALMAATLDQFGRVDILINNAGAARFAPVWELSAEDFDFNLNVNLRGTFLCSRAALRSMIPRQHGSIINIASSSGKKPYVEQGAYCAAKAGVIALTKVMALELRAHHIRVCVISPGAVDSKLADEIHPHRDRTGWIQPGDVAAAVLYVLSASENIALDEIVLRRFNADPI